VERNTPKRSLARKWYDKYLPFVARSPEMQLEWLVNALRKKTLTFQEITPYVRLLLADENDEKHDLLMDLINGLDQETLERMFSAADIYDAPRLFGLLKKPTESQARIMLKKELPPYDKTPQATLDRVFWSIYGFGEEFMRQVCDGILLSDEAPTYFEQEYKRFLEIVEDEKILSALYPKARSNL